MTRDKEVKSLAQAIGESTCQKRVTVCEIYDQSGVLLARESNRCAPESGVCSRLGVVQHKGNYDLNSACNWTHAEINAIVALPKEGKPYRAIIYGHSFYCDGCEKALKAIGCVELIVEPVLFERS